ncbi:Protein FAM219A [Camelus dromedarius]|uniref:Protein FAM219A n=1 Tax=Camelus dromedarius TaxID=9838 RepID=A0A5N4BZU4_CAMDR|nr:Protein FAM219A [Camelus dromedarius]
MRVPVTRVAQQLPSPQPGPILPTQSPFSVTVAIQYLQPKRRNADEVICTEEGKVSPKCLRAQDPAAASISDGDCDAREGESVAMNYKPSPLQVKLEKQRELARKGSLKNGSMGSPVNQQPKKNNVMARTRLVVPNKGYSSLDQSPDEKPLVALDTDSDDDFDMSRYSSSGYSSAEQINQDLNIQLLKDGYRLDEIPDDEDLDLIPPKSVNPTCMCCQATSSTACHIQ